MKAMPTATIGAFICAGLCLGGGPAAAQVEFRRGDADGSGAVDLGDAVTCYCWLFVGVQASCRAAMDVNGDSQPNIADFVFLWNWLYLGGPPPSAPGPFDCSAGSGPNDQECASYDCAASGSHPETEEFRLGFASGARIGGGPARSFLCTLIHSGTGTGAAAVSFGVVAEGGRITAISHVGTETEPALYTTFLTAAGDGNEGALGVAFMARYDACRTMTIGPLPTNGTSAVARLIVEPLGGSETVTLRYREGLRAEAQPGKWSQPVKVLVTRLAGLTTETLVPGTVAETFSWSEDCLPGDPDRDVDGVCDGFDNCPDAPNPDQTDANGDGVGNICDPVFLAADTDDDGVADDDDNCPATFNPDQADEDGDGRGDVCDLCLGDAQNTCCGGGFSDGPGLVGTAGCVPVPAVGDLDGDGLADIVVDRGIAGQFEVVLAKAGGFRPPVKYSAAGTSSSAVADLDGDGSLDVLRFRTGAASILIGNGDGTLKAPVQVSMTNTSVPRIGDMDGDGNLDIVANKTGGFFILPGDGNGGFLPAIHHPAAGLGTIAALGDVDGDGTTDIVALNSYVLADGAGGFQAPVDLGLTSPATHLGLADLDLDGRQDIVVHQSVVQCQVRKAQVSVLLAHPDGGFRIPRAYPIGSPDERLASGNLAFGDFDRDGRTDVVVSTGDMEVGDQVTLFLGRPGGVLSQPLQFSPMNGNQLADAAPLAAGDLDGDGWLDLAVGIHSIVSCFPLECWKECPGQLMIYWNSCQGMPICPSTGDTHCLDLQVSGPDGGVPGTYTVTATAKDDSGDPTTFIFTADRGDEAPNVVGPQTGTSAAFDLAEGSWTISVEVDDDPGCPDEAADARRSVEVIVIKPGGRIVPGDANGDGAPDLSDPVAILGILFTGSGKLFPCGDGSTTHPANVTLLDWQPDGAIDLSDAVAGLSFLFLGGRQHALAVPGAASTGCIRIADCPDHAGCP